MSERLEKSLGKESRLLSTFLVRVGSDKYRFDVYSGEMSLGIFEDLRIGSVNYAFPFRVNVDVYKVFQDGTANKILENERMIFCFFFLKENQKRHFDIEEAVLWSHVKKNQGAFFAEIFEEEVVPSFILPADSRFKEITGVSHNVIFLPLEKGFEIFERQVKIVQEYYKALREAVKRRVRELTEGIYVKEKDDEKIKKAILDELWELQQKGYIGSLRDLIITYVEDYGRFFNIVLKDVKVEKDIDALKKRCKAFLKDLKNVADEEAKIIESKLRNFVFCMKSLFPEKEISFDVSIDEGPKKTSTKTSTKIVKPTNRNLQ